VRHQLVLLLLPALAALSCWEEPDHPIPRDDDDDAAASDDDTGYDDDPGDDDSAPLDCVTSDALEGCDFVVPASCATIQAAILAASYEDSICVQPGTYYENVSFSGREVRVLGMGGVEGTIIDGGAAGAVVAFSQGEGPTATLSGFTLRNGEWMTGGGIYVRGADPTLWQLRIEDNVATQHGGGVYLQEASPLLLDVEITGNDAGGAGGAMYLWESSPILERVTVEGNTAGGTAGISLDNSHPTMTDVIITGNTSDDGNSALTLHDSAPLTNRVDIHGNAAPSGATVYLGGNDVHLSHVTIRDNTADRGGGVAMSYVDNGPDPVLEHVIITGNQASTFGGGIYSAEASPLLSDLYIEGNHSAYDGGGIYAWAWHSYGTAELRNVAVVNNTADRNGGGIKLSDDAQTEVYNAIVLGNRASEDGGGIFHGGSLFSAHHVVVAGNEAAGKGGAVWADNGGFQCTNCIVANNVAATGGGLATDYGLAGVVTTNVFGNHPDDYSGAADRTGILGNVSVDPLFLDTDSLDPADWDLHLATDSPMIDAADPTLPDPDGSPPDLGAYGGTHADSWDLDWDGYPEWWMPGEYDPVAYPDLGWDCDDRDGEVHPGGGC